MTPSGVEQKLKTIEVNGSTYVNPTMTPPGVEQAAAMIQLGSGGCEPDDDAPGR